MALIKCKECGRDVSDKAQNCPHCGALIHQENVETQGAVVENKTQQEYYQEESNGSRKLLYVIIALLVALIAGGVYYLVSGSGDGSGDSGSSSGSDSGDKDVKEFVAKFAQAVEGGDRATIDAMYPDAKNAESLALKYNADSMRIEEMQAENQFKVHLGKTDLVLTKDENKQVKVKESFGLFVWPEDKMDFALATGWVTKELNDVQIAERFADEGFVNSLSEKLLLGLKTKLKATCGSVSNYSSGMSKYHVTVNNNNDFDVPADAYSVVLTEIGWDADLLEDVPVGTKTLGGVPIGARSVARIPVPGNYDYEYSSFKVALRVNYGKEQALKNLLKPTGNEYAEYLAGKGK